MAATPDTAFVTGGSGFIGQALVRRLVAGGSRVRALARSQRSAAAITALGAEPVRGDLGDASSIAVGADGCAAAFHLAARVADSGPLEQFMRDNVEGTKNALEGCHRAGVARFVHCGTEAALLAGEPLRNVDETAALRPDSKAPYSATKALAELEVRGAAGDGFETVVVRPRFVWGAGDTTLLPQMVEMVESGRFAWIGGGSHLTDVTHVENVVEGLLLGWERGRSGEAYFVTDGTPIAFREFVTELLETQGVSAPRRSVPAALAATLATAAEAAWRWLPLPGEPPLTRFAYWAAAQECTIDISKARTELGYEPLKSRAEGMAELRASA